MTNKPMLSVELLPCPFCGSNPALPDGYGTQYEIECSGCGQATSSIQICDLMTIDERADDMFNDYRYGEEFIERAKLAAIESWNNRVEPADQHQEDPAVWSYCPECGCEETHHEEGKHKQCANCHQEWFSDIDYSEVVRGNLQKLKAEQPAPVFAVIPDVDRLAQIIRKVDGSHNLGAGSLAEAILEEVARLNGVKP